MNKRRTITFFLLVMFGSGGRAASTLTETLEHDLQRGKISQAQNVAYHLLGIKKSPQLPEPYRSMPQPTTRLGTGLAMEARLLLDRAAADERQLLQAALSRPTHLPFSLISPSKRFRIHYDLIGPDAAADAFVLQTAAACDYAYHLLIDVMGYPPPPRDDVDGPEYDVYLYNIVDYGFSTPDNPAPTAAFPFGYTSFIQMDNDFVSTYSKGLDGMQVTAAHEFYHMVQLGMRNFTTSELDSRWFYEACASWIEDVAYDEINDYYQYLPHYLSNLHRSLRTFNGLHEYGAGLFFHMIEKKHGAAVIRRMWENFAKNELYEAIDVALKTVGSSLAVELTDHMIWNFFTGERADPQRRYPEGEDYPTLKPHLTQELQKTVGFADETQLLSARFVQIAPQDFGSLTVVPQFEAPARWQYAVVAHSPGLTPEIFTHAGNGETMINAVNAAQTLMLITVNTATPRNDMSTSEQYQYSLTLGPADQLSAGIRRVFPNPFVPEANAGGMRIDVRLLKRTREMTLFILNENGVVVYRSEIKFDVEKNGDLAFFWDGRSESGETVNSGIYYLYVQAGEEIAPVKAAVLR